MLIASITIVVAALVAWFTMVWWMPAAWYRALLYPGGRPNAVARWLNSRQAAMSNFGFGPSWLVALETRGWRTGKASRVPLVVAEAGGERYLVSMLGEHVNWVRNVRASNGQAVIVRRTARPVKLTEVAVVDRAPILQAYLRRAPGARPHFEVAMDDSIEDFARVAAGYPVFRILSR